MNLLTEHLDVWVAAQAPKAKGGRGRGKKSNGQSPHGIQKLRELILELAVRGKLVPQDPNDEPASVLLEKIAQEKARLIKEGKIKKQKKLPEVREEEKPFELPDGWEICHFGVLVNSILSGGTPSKRNPEFWDGDIPWASVKDLGKSKYLEETMDHITQKGLDAGSKLAEINDVIICTRMGLGKIAIAKARIAINQDLKAVKFTSHLNLDYFLIFFATLNIKGTGTTVAGIKQEELLNYFFPLPPLAEQQCIVAKVDELMTLCDQLEQQQTDSNATHQILLETLLATLTNAADHDEFTQAWQRIANHFDTLFTTEQSIDQLKQTILQFAVMGKLVPQKPDDEPASVLLGKIAKEKARLIKEGKIKKQKKLPEIREGEKLFELPKGWVWVRLGNIAIFENGDRSSRYPKDNDLQSSGVPFFGAKDMMDGVLRFGDGLRFISEDKFLNLSNGKLCDQDFVVLLRGTVGKMAIFHANKQFSTGFINAQMIIIRMLNKNLCDFFRFYISSTFFHSLVDNKTTGSAVSQMPASALFDFLIPLPPYAEQCRIVSKIEELMSICNILEAGLTAAQTNQNHLADAFVEQVVA